MGDFPWQKKDGDQDSAFEWDSRMPWQRGDRGAGDDTDAGASEPDVREDPASEVRAGADDAALAAPADADAPTEVADAASTADAESATVSPDAGPVAAEPASESALPPYARGLPSSADTRPGRGSRAPMTPTQPTGRPAPRVGTPPPRPKRGRAGIAGTVIVVGFVAVLGVGGFLVDLAEDGGETAAEAPTEEELAEMRTESTRAVTEYFAAIQAGDAEAALATTDIDLERDAEYYDVSFLTDEVLARSQEMAPIDDVVVGDVEIDPEYTWITNVEVSYTLDGEETNTVIQVNESYGGEYPWAIRGTMGVMRFSDALFDDLDPQLAGQDAPLDTSILLFPGRYDFTLPGAPQLSLTEMAGIEPITDEASTDGDAVITAPLPSESYAKLAVSERGRTMFEDALTAAIEECAASTAAASGCSDPDYSSRPPAELVDGTVVRRIAEREEPIEPRFDIEDPSLMTAYTSIKLEYDATCADGSACTGWEFLATPVIEFADGEAVATSWER